MIPQIPESVIADSAAAVFSAAEYVRGRPSIIGRIYRWVRDLFSPLGDATGSSPALYWSLIIGGGLLGLLLVGRAVYLAHRRRAGRATESGGRQAAGLGGRPGDPWRAAEALAASGDFTAAAHSLYLALLEGIARRERLRLHPAMTVGDYARALRARSSGLFARFREFATSYETVVYGTGTCDRERYERLRALALPIVQADG